MRSHVGFKSGNGGRRQYGGEVVDGRRGAFIAIFPNQTERLLDQVRVQQANHIDRKI